MKRNNISSANPSPIAREKKIVRRNETMQQADQHRSFLLKQHFERAEQRFKPGRLPSPIATKLCGLAKWH